MVDMDEKRTMQDVLGLESVAEKVLSNKESPFWKALEQTVVAEVKKGLENGTNNLLLAINQAMDSRDKDLASQLNEAIQFAMSNIGRLDLELATLMKILIEKGNLTTDELNTTFESVKAEAVELAKKAAADQEKKTKEEIDALEQMKVSTPEIPPVEKTS